MPPASVAALLEALRSHRLLYPAQLEEACTLQGKCAGPQDLARALLGRGWLTQFQIKRLFQDRGAELVLGPYVLLERLGKGGMGQVFKARHQLMNRVVALKIIARDYLANPEAVLRFQREIQMAARLSHPNIVAALHADQIGDQHFLVMEYVEGIDLHHLVARDGRLPWARAAHYIAQAARGLQHAHERSMVHRDIKPSNLLLAREGEVVKVLDMGLARSNSTTAVGLSASQLTQLGTIVGTPDFIAPEQILHPHLADIRADVYSLGCTLYFLLAGHPPFPGGTLADKLLWHQTAPPRPVESLRPEVPAELAAVLRRMLAKSPLDRYQTPADVADALAPFRPEGPSGGGEKSPAVASHTWIAVAGAGVVLLAALALILMLTVF